MTFVQEFKAFAMRGNVVDLAVWVVIGGAFGKIVSSLVADIIMPVIGVLTGGVNFTDFKLTLKDAMGEAPAVTLNWWAFIQSAVDFVIVALCIFMVVKAMSKLQKKKESAPAKVEDTKTEKLLCEIRDLLEKKKS